MPTAGLESRIKESFDRAEGFSGICFRLVSPRFANQRDVLSSEGGRIHGGRYNLKGTFGVLYLSCDVLTCTVEVTHAARASAFEVSMTLPRVIVGIEVELSKVLDLSDNKVRRGLGIRNRDLVEADWQSAQRSGREAMTQNIGRLARDAGFEALLVPSAVWRGKNLDVITDNLLPSSKMSVLNKDLLQL